MEVDNPGGNMENPAIREFKVAFRAAGKNIQVHMHTQGVGPQEAIGFLEMAKDQILSNLRAGRQEIFSSQGEVKEGKR